MYKMLHVVCINIQFLTDWDVYIEQYGSGFLVVYLDVAGFTQIKMWFPEFVKLCRRIIST